MVGGGNSHQFGSFCYLFPTRRVHSSAFILSRLQLLGILPAFILVELASKHSLNTVRALFCIPYGTSAKLHSPRTGFICTQLPQSFGIQHRTVLLQNLDSARTGFICTQLPYGPFEFTGRYNTSLSPPRGPYGLCFAYRTVLLQNFIQPVRVSFVHKYI